MPGDRQAAKGPAIALGNQARRLPGVGGEDRFGVTLFSRRRKSLNRKFPYIVEALAELPEETVVDGELVGLDDVGRPNFNLSANSISKASSEKAGQHLRAGEKKWLMDQTSGESRSSSSTFRLSSVR
jgi:hypothetical protein